MPPPSSKQFSGIFISYRREDASGHAGRLSDKLSEHFRKDKIFMDIDNIQPGEDFVQVIENAVGSCEILIAIIGRQWLASPGETSRRLDDPSDFVRLEIASALKREIPVVPVLVQRATMPKPQDLSDDLTKFSRLNAIEISDLRWQHDVDQLIGVLEGILTSRNEERNRGTDEKAEHEFKKKEEKRRAEELERQAKERQEREAEQEAERHRLEKKDLRGRQPKPRRRWLMVAIGAALLFTLVLVVGSIAFVWLRTMSESRQRSTYEDPTPTSSEQTGSPGAAAPSATENTTTSQQTDERTSKSPTTATPSSQEHEEAEAQAAERAAQTKAEEEASQKWYVVIMRTRLSAPLTYQIFEDGIWNKRDLPAGLQYTEESHQEMRVKYQDGSGEREMTVQSVAIVGHQPTESEKVAANAYYFQVDAEGKIALYSN